MERISTGIPQLDMLLGGGFPANAIHVVTGSPGSGKTILAEQLVFANASKERPALYVTTVSEPLPKFLAYLEEYAFADTSRIGEAVTYTSVADALVERPETTIDVVERLLLEHRPRVIVIDSFKAIADMMPDIATWRRQLHQLAGLLSAYSTTTFWIGEYSLDMKWRLPEFAVADGIVELTREQQGSRDFRFVHVVKLRGSSFLDGYHAFQITRAGLDVFPRLRTPALSAEYVPVAERLKSGVPGLDAMIASGWLRGTTTTVIGPSGAGKTVLALHFLREGAVSGEAGLLLTFEENPVQIARMLGQLGWDAGALLVPGKIEVLFSSPVELQIDTIVRSLFERIERSGVRRVVIDGVADLAYTANDPLRFRDYLFALTQQFAARNITALFTVQNTLPDGGATAHAEISYLADNVLLLEMRMGEELTRTVRVLKTRGGAHDPNRRVLTITSAGMVVR